ncbi:MAG: Sec-independent protein translocase subunit TatA [Candidatus Nanopelagicaceae bacterium]|jgi:TatA/E family protein of Tat protein translocase
MFLREPTHILLLVLVLVILFGAKRLPDSAKSVAKSLRIFKSEMKDGKEEPKEDKKDSQDN